MFQTVGELGTLARGGREHMIPLEKGKDACDIETKTWKGPELERSLKASSVLQQPGMLNFYIQMKELEMILECYMLPIYFLPERI